LSHEHRLLEPSRWIALALAFMDISIPRSEIKDEVFKRLESAFDAEMDAEVSA
jgi:hypothetical protein